ncbi:polyprenyl synthetase family protein [Herbivorax sp. ANBcel31]|uniref:polyprenyl synthetase family protein n=1 Tax=Herbivorax sp. ANBcel31 TaxID=3069754 RepID=UPI0027B0E217|nr:polyprenyl synthetase family protein [Herbivorax sp. ANBcel31]MDQ2085682.1 polyprenyl synthetase family protein [Herbivorax sp. ANBcel31]
MSVELMEFLKEKEKDLVKYIKGSDVQKYFRPKHMYDAVISYVYRSAKRLRPSVLIMSCGCLGGEERVAIPAAAAVELFHTWTLVHDDIIDNDSLRRGEPTTHLLLKDAGKADLKLSDKLAEDYGKDIAILAGDVQHAWSITFLIETTTKMGIDPCITLEIIKYMESYAVGNLIYGEAVDVQMGMTDSKAAMKFTEDDIINMMWGKTGVLYGFSGLAGAMIGKGTSDINDSQVTSIKDFTSNCGIAFQLQDDILGIVGDEKILGKPIGSDIREGKKTTIVLESLKNANEEQKSLIFNVLGNKDASENDVKNVIKLFKELNGVEHTKTLAQKYIEKALPNLNEIEDSKYKNLLLCWADFMINRDL